MIVGISGRVKASVGIMGIPVLPAPSAQLQNINPTGTMFAGIARAIELKREDAWRPVTNMINGRVAVFISTEEHRIILSVSEQMQKVL